MRARVRVPPWCVVAGLLLAPIPACSDAVTQSSPTDRSTAGAAGDDESTTTAAASAPTFNDLEQDIADALDHFDLVAHRAELPGPTSASLWAVVDDGGELYVSALLAGTNRGNPRVIGETTVDGVVIRTVEYPSGISRLSFDCDPMVYEVSGQAPSGGEDLAGFAAALSTELGCG